MKKATAGILAVMVCGALAAGALASCSGGSSSAAASSAAGSASASTAASSESTTASASSAAASSGSAEASSSDGLLAVDGATIKEVSVDMVGDTPNLMVIFANNSDKDVEIDCGKFEVKKDDGTVVNFTNSKKTIGANKPYVQWAFTTKAGSLKAGDKVTISFDGTNLGTYEVTEF